MMNLTASCWQATRLSAIGIAIVAFCADVSTAVFTEMSGAVELLTNADLQAFADNCANCGGKFYASKATPGHENDARVSTVLMAFNERQNVTLPNALNTSNPPYAQQFFPFPMGIGWQRPGPVIPAGSVVNSHYIWLNSPAAVLSHDIATLKFDGPILGVIGKPEDLFATNNLLGFNSSESDHPFIEYTPTASGFVNEDYPNNPTPTGSCPCSGDIIIRNAPAKLTIDFSSYAGDYVRVVTAANVPPHAGDFDRDYDVDLDDRALWMATFDSDTDFRADANSDGIVNAADYVVWRANLGYAYTFPPSAAGSGASQAGAVPEPASALLLLLAACTGSQLMRRRK